MPDYEKFSNQSAPEDAGVEKLYKFLERSGFSDTLCDSELFRDWVEQLSFEEFQEHLVRLNGIVRGIPISARKVDGEDVHVGNEMMGIGFLPPHPDDKLELLRETFEKVKTMENVEDRGLLLYLTTQYLHLFNDGNGRLGRLLYYLTNKAQDSSRITPEEMRGLLAHDGDSGPGRDVFYKEVKLPSDISNIINQLSAREILSADFIKQKRRPFANDLNAGSIHIENKDIEPELKKQLESVLSEAEGGRFSFRDLVMVKYLEDHGLLEEYEEPLDESDMDEGTKELQKTMYRYDANRLLSSISEEDAKEMIEISRDIKKRFVEKLIDIISEPKKYRINEQKTVKDLFYTGDGK